MVLGRGLPLELGLRTKRWQSDDCRDAKERAVGLSARRNLGGSAKDVAAESYFSYRPPRSPVQNSTGLSSEHLPEIIVEVLSLLAFVLSMGAWLVQMCNLRPRNYSGFSDKPVRALRCTSL